MEGGLAVVSIVQHPPFPAPHISTIMASSLSLTTCIPLLSLLCASSSAWVAPLPPSVNVRSIPLHATEGDAEDFVMPPVDQLVSDTPIDQRGIGVGIDLGTTNSAAAILIDGVPTIVPVGDGSSSNDTSSNNSKSGRTIPSVVSILSKDQVLVGKEAVQAEVDNPSATYRNVKRVLGQGGTTAAVSAEVVPNLLIKSASARRKGRNIGKHKSTMQPSLTQQLKEAEESPARLQCAVEDMSILAPEEISAKVLRKLYDAVEKRRGTGEKVTRAVIGVPAYFNDAQRDATLRASKLAGVEKARLLREPEAAALAYGIGKEQAGEKEDDELVLVFDLGGGTFDVSILEVGGGITEVVATAGNNMLGGSDFDTRVAEFMAKRMAAHGAERIIYGMVATLPMPLCDVPKPCVYFSATTRLPTWRCH